MSNRISLEAQQTRLKKKAERVKSDPEARARVKLHLDEVEKALAALPVVVASSASSSVPSVGAAASSES